MKTTWSWWGRHGIGVVLRTPWNCLCKCNHFRGVFAKRVLRVYYVYGDVTTLGSRRARPHRVLTAFQVRSPNLGVCFEHAQNKRRDSATIGDHWRPWRPQHDVRRFYHVYTTFIPRLWRPRRAVRTSSRCDGGIRQPSWFSIWQSLKERKLYNYHQNRIIISLSAIPPIMIIFEK